MAPDRYTPDGFFAELEQLGEDEVHNRVAAGIYSSANRKKELAELWLSRKDQARSDADRSEALKTARSASAAAVRAADAAELAAAAAESQATIARRAWKTAIVAIIVISVFVYFAANLAGII